MGEVEKNLRICIAEKERKIAQYRHKYTEWWLVLADHIDHSMEPDDRDIFRTKVMPGIHYSFDKIVLINPWDHHQAFIVGGGE